MIQGPKVTQEDSPILSGGADTQYRFSKTAKAVMDFAFNCPFASMGSMSISSLATMNYTFSSVAGVVCFYTSAGFFIPCVCAGVFSSRFFCEDLGCGQCEWGCTKVTIVRSQNPGCFTPCSAWCLEEV